MEFEVNTSMKSYWHFALVFTFLMESFSLSNKLDSILSAFTESSHEVSMLSKTCYDTIKI